MLALDRRMMGNDLVVFGSNSAAAAADVGLDEDDCLVSSSLG